MYYKDFKKSIKIIHFFKVSYLKHFFLEKKECILMCKRKRNEVKEKKAQYDFKSLSWPL